MSDDLPPKTPDSDGIDESVTSLPTGCRQPTAAHLELNALRCLLPMIMRNLKLERVRAATFTLVLLSQGAESADTDSECLLLSVASRTGLEW